MRIQLREVHFTDYYSKGFMEFYQKYKARKYLSDKSLYVQFTNKDNTTDKTFVTTPSHNDPSGNYAYPLEYVIKYPADIWYGNNTTHLRVLRKRPDSKGILLSDIDYYRALALLQNIGYSYDPYRLGKRKDSQYSFWNQGNWNEMKKRFPKRISGANQDAKRFWQYIQTDYRVDESDKNLMTDKLDKNFKIRNAVEQNRLLQLMGFDWVEDKSKKDTSAIINDREPEQILFLNRNFDIVDIFRLSDTSQEKSMNTKDPDSLKKKLAVQIFEATDDKISEQDRNIFYSKKGRVIVIDSQRPKDYYDTRNIGQKLHKEFGKYDSYYFIITYFTEYGEILKLSFPLSATIDEIVLDVKEIYEEKKSKNELDPDFKFRSIKIDKEDKERKDKERFEKEDRENKDLFEKYIKSNEFKENCDFIAEYFNIPKLDISYIKSNLDTFYTYLDFYTENKEVFKLKFEINALTKDNSELKSKIENMDSRLSYFFDTIVNFYSSYVGKLYLRLVDFHPKYDRYSYSVEEIISRTVYRIEEKKEKEEELNKKEENYIDSLNHYFKS